MFNYRASILFFSNKHIVCLTVNLFSYSHSFIGYRMSGLIISVFMFYLVFNVSAGIEVVCFSDPYKMFVE